MIEQILTDLHTGDPDWNIVLLRYFNPIGAHESGLIGEDPQGVPNNLVPYVAQVAAGVLPFVRVFGSDYPTPDGTGIRDYIHVVDLARGHVAALRWMSAQHNGGANDVVSALESGNGEHGVEVFNLGTGHGSSVLEVVKAYSRACNQKLPYQLMPRRDGDIAECYAACDKASEILDWQAEYDLDRMCVDSWRWQKTNPQGYE